MTSSRFSSSSGDDLNPETLLFKAVVWFWLYAITLGGWILFDRHLKLLEDLLSFSLVIAGGSVAEAEH